MKCLGTIHALGVPNPRTDIFVNLAVDTLSE
jgi:hypothetical protein